jgi:thermostable 8-oxoguanine DNA glycosylase
VRSHYTISEEYSMKLTKKSDHVLPEQTQADNTQTKSNSLLEAVTGLSMDRRSFLRNSGLMAGGAVLASGLSAAMMRKAQAAEADSSKHALFCRLRNYGRGDKWCVDLTRTGV